MSVRIQIRELSKAYQLGQVNLRPGSLRDELARFIRHPMRRRDRATAVDELWALSDVTFDIEEGDVVGVVGRNGSGKSTLLKILSRIVEPTRGEVRIRGRVTSLLEVGTGFHPELTGRENVRLNGTLLGMPRREIARRFDEIVEFSGVERFLDTPVKFYSSGMYVRLAFAVAAHLEPDILIVDEVLSVGDVGFQRKSLGKMHDIAGEGRTVLFVSHNADSVRSLCSRGVHLSAGRVAEIGTVDEALASYQAELEEGVAATDPSVARKPYGAGGALIVSLKVLDSSGEPSAELDMEEEMVLSLTAHVEQELVGRPLYVGFGIGTEGGISVFTTFSSWQDVNFVPRQPTLTVACRVPRLRMASGRYLVSATILSDISMIDHVPCGASFVVRAPKDEILWPQYVAAHGPLRVDCVYEELSAPGAVDPEVAA